MHRLMYMLAGLLFVSLSADAAVVTTVPVYSGSVDISRTTSVDTKTTLTVTAQSQLLYLYEAQQTLGPSDNLTYGPQKLRTRLYYLTNYLPISLTQKSQQAIVGESGEQLFGTTSSFFEPASVLWQKVTIGGEFASATVNRVEFSETTFGKYTSVYYVDQYGSFSSHTGTTVLTMNPIPEPATGILITGLICIACGRRPERSI